MRWRPAGSAAILADDVRDRTRDDGHDRCGTGPGNRCHHPSCALLAAHGPSGGRLASGLVNRPAMRAEKFQRSAPSSPTSR
jgi:hypothetical protein